MSFEARRRDRPSEVVGAKTQIQDPTGNLADPVEKATTPALYNVTCTTANTEYSRALPADTKKFLIKARGGNLQVCFTSGQSGTTYLLLFDGQAYNEDNIEASITLYFRSPTAGTIAEIVAWS